MQCIDFTMSVFFLILGGLVGAAHVLNDNASVLRCEDMAYRSFMSEKCAGRCQKSYINLFTKEPHRVEAKTSASELEKNGSFKFRGPINMRLKRSLQGVPARASIHSQRSHASSRGSLHTSKTLRMLVTKKLKEAIN